MNEIFKQHPKLDFVFKTSDGTCFYEEGDARNHARSLENRAVEKVTRTVGKAPAAPKGNKVASAPKGEGEEEKISPFQAAKLRIEAIEAMDTVAAIEEALKEETAKTVLKAGAERIAAINAEVALNDEGENPNVTTS